MTSRSLGIAVRVASAWTVARRPGGTAHEAVAPLRDPAFRALWISTFAWNFARWMEMTITSWIALQLTGSAWLVALIGVARSAALPVSGPVTGALSDRLDRLLMIRWSGWANVVVMGSIAAALVTGHGMYWQLFIGSLWLGASWGIDWPVRRSLLADFVGPDRVLPAIVLDNVAFNVARVVGPLVAGGALATWGSSGAFVLLAFGFLIASLSVLAVPSAAGARPASTGRASIWGDLKGGYDYVRADPVVAGVILVSFFMNVLVFPYQGLLSVVADDILHVGPAELGALGAATGIGAAISVFLQPLFRSTRAQGLAFVVGALSGAVALVGFSLSSTYLVSLFLLFLTGLGTSSFGTMQSSLVLSRASTAMRGRSMGMVTLAIGSAPIGALIVGAVADTFGVAAAIGGASGICLIIVGAIAARFGMFGRNLVAPPHRPGDPEPVITHAPADSPIAPPESITVDDPSPARATV
jgi:MFS family permease